MKGVVIEVFDVEIQNVHRITNLPSLFSGHVRTWRDLLMRLSVVSALTPWRAELIRVELSRANFVFDRMLAIEQHVTIVSSRR